MDEHTANPLSGRRIGLVGGGNLGEALIRGLLESGAVPPGALTASDPSQARRAHLASRYGIAVSDDNGALARGADVLVLAVKPQVMAVALAELAPAFRSETLVVSVAAGVRIATLEAGLAAGARPAPAGGAPTDVPPVVRVVRAMPNAAALALAAATALAPGGAATAADLALARALFDAVGRTVVVPEGAIDAVTGLSGSGPAYVMLVIEALADGGVCAGLPRDVALGLAAQTVLGAAKLQLDTNEHPAVWKDRVTSPGGTTAAGLVELESGGVRGAFIRAVGAATARARALGG
ncbi:MAG: pyrroline-5-carboxylate reductase [Polyangiaceae bacterium]|nr:pyrroline-5-carboxylate reductase [Polyangiaceae bacterium]